jgi:hypothetical protein
MKDTTALANEAFLVSFAHMGKVLVFSIESLMAEITDRDGCRPLSFPREPYFLKLIRIVEVRADEWPVGQEYTRYVHV